MLSQLHLRESQHILVDPREKSEKTNMRKKDFSSGRQITRGKILL